MLLRSNYSGLHARIVVIAAAVTTTGSVMALLMPCLSWGNEGILERMHLEFAPSTSAAYAGHSD